MSGTTPFLAACRNRHKRIVKKLISHKDVDVNCKDMAGLTGVSWLDLYIEWCDTINRVVCDTIYRVVCDTIYRMVCDTIYRVMWHYI